MLNPVEDAPNKETPDSGTQVRTEDGSEENKKLEEIEKSIKNEEDIDMYQTTEDTKAPINKAKEEDSSMEIDLDEANPPAPPVQNTTDLQKDSKSDIQAAAVLLNNPTSTSSPSFAPNSISCEFQSESTLILNNESIKLAQISYKFRSLQISSNEIFFTGPSPSGIFKSYILDTNTLSLQELHCSLVKTRELHAMSFLNNHPAVIGGIENNAATGSVQVYSNGSFIEYPSLNQPRYGHSAVFHKLTWVFAGAVSESLGANQVECFNGSAWSSLSIEHKFDSVGLGLVSHQDSILVLGGFNISKTCTNSVYVFTPNSENLSESTLRPGLPLAVACSFSQNLWKIEDNVLTSYSFLGKKDKLEMSKESYSNFKISEFKIGSVSDTISAAFGKAVKPSSQPKDSFVKKRLENLRDMSGSGRETFLTEAQISEIEEQVAKDGYSPMSYEEMIKEVDDIRFGMKNRDYELMELKKRLERCRSEIEVREDGLNGIDRTLNDIKSQNKELTKRINSSMSLARLNT